MHAVVQWLKIYAASRKAKGSRPDKVIECLQFTESLHLHHGPRIYSASSRNEYQKIFLGVKSGWRARLTS
jgi:hypothetical protein